MTIHTVGELRARHLTGRVRGRVGWFGRVVMQVEVRSPEPHYPRPPRPGAYDPWGNGSYTFWRDATHDDLASGGCAPRSVVNLAPAPSNPPSGGTSGSKA
ncbi:hypothetical protein [Methylorubrum populi]|uniref:Uncharacterized protein n=1 Tax=Methylorubrum populi TaxID=223967 RepID=A0A833J4G1_9HYPH|nr:hypothetical protein [Methylorubrum populi]KAB7783467.1 hypothetical protein F8B43_4029 [Methylorubrum populi]